MKDMKRELILLKQNIGFIEAHMLDEKDTIVYKDMDKSQIPKDIYFSERTKEFFKIKSANITENEMQQYIQLKKLETLTTIKNIITFCLY